MILKQTEPFDGLNITEPVELASRINIVIGRNGAGKTRLLKAIATGKIVAEIDSVPVLQQLVRYSPNALEASFGGDANIGGEISIRREICQSYRNHRGKFFNDPAKTLAEMYGPFTIRGKMMSRDGALLPIAAHIASLASERTGKDINSLSDQDIDDYYSPEAAASLGKLNLSAIIRSYIERITQNKQAEFENFAYESNHEVYSAEEFERKFGPKPWEIINLLLMDGLGRGYRISVPDLKKKDAYILRLYRFDGQEISFESLSSGEKSLLWILFTMYATSSGLADRTAKLILLDEPDSPLHPEMIQKFHNSLQALASTFDTYILITTHSPTTVALAENSQVYEITESSLEPIEKDVAISKLLLGVNKLSVHYSNRRQVYVESNNDESIYTEIFRLMHAWGRLNNPYISLSFIPAAPKLSDESVKAIVQTHLGEFSEETLKSFLASLNGEGNSASVKATVDSLVAKGNPTVHGIVDWDIKNKPLQNVHIHAENIFYSMENAILNPLALGLYLLTQWREKINCVEFGLPDDFGLAELFSNEINLQLIIDKICMDVLGEDKSLSSISCEFIDGSLLQIPKEYAHCQGKALQEKIYNKYLFLKGLPLKKSLMSEVIAKVIVQFKGRGLPASFLKLFTEIQTCN